MQSKTVDAVSHLTNFHVDPNPAFASLIVTSFSELAEDLNTNHGDGIKDSRGLDERERTLQAAVMVLVEDNAEVRAFMEHHNLSGILCPNIDIVALHPTLVSLLATDQAAEDRLVLHGAKVLTQVARHGGVGAVTVELARRIDGWAVVLDSEGDLISSSGAGTLHLQDAAAMALSLPVRVRHPGIQVHSVGQREDLTAYLVLASRSANMSRVRDLAAQTAALLDLLLRKHDHAATEKLGREVMIRSLLEDSVLTVGSLLRRWGVHDKSLTAFALSSRSKSVDLEQLVSRWFDDIGHVHVMTRSRGEIIGFVRNDSAVTIAKKIEEYAGRIDSPLRCGFGTSAPLDALNRGMTEAHEAHMVAQTEGKPVSFYATLPTVRYVLNRLNHDSMQQLKSSLDGLRDPEGLHGDLTLALQTFLEENGVWGVTAHRLGIHRQTLTTRIHSIEKLTGLSMSNPDDRASAWLALRALHR